MWGNANALDALIAAGANVNAQNQLSAASPCTSRRPPSRPRWALGRAAQRLLEAGADARLLDEDGDAPYEKVLGGDDFARELRALLQTAFGAPPVFVSVRYGGCRRHNCFKLASVFSLGGGGAYRKATWRRRVDGATARVFAPGCPFCSSPKSTPEAPIDARKHKFDAP